MKNYYKLILVTVTVVSVVCFLFYKTQYDKLYNVLEVLEFFGTEPDARGPLCRDAYQTGVATFRPPAFQRISDDIYVYSAFCAKDPSFAAAADTGEAEKIDEQCPRVLLIAMVRGDSAKNLRCRLW